MSIRSGKGSVDKSHVVAGPPDDEGRWTAGGCVFWRRRARWVYFSVGPGVATDPEQCGGRGLDPIGLAELDEPVLVGAVGARGPERDVEVAVVDRCGEIDGQRQRFTDAVGVGLNGAHNDGGGDSAEGADHVGPLRMGPATLDVFIYGVEVNGVVERVRPGHSDS